MEALLAAILGFFVFPCLGFWLLAIFLSVVYTIATEVDTHGFAVFSTIVGVALLWKTIALGFAVWPLMLIGLGVYLLIGGGWSVWRYRKFCQEFIVKNPFKDRSGSDSVDYSDGKQYTLSAGEYYRKKLRPSEHKSRLIGWIAYWPWSLIWNVAGDALTAM